MSAPDSTDRPAPLRHLKWIGWTAVVLVGALLVVRVVFKAKPAAPPSWTSSSGIPTPPDFLYAMFLVNGAIE